ncbi:MAG: peptide-methionine (S)-S-oxide reductase MsrA [Verrucomicrobiota bacterium]
MKVSCHPTLLFLALVLPIFTACGSSDDTAKAVIPEELNEFAVATLAGGCFWCLEGPFEKEEGVKAVFSGYTGGPEVDPSYQDVAYGRTGHTEAVQVFYDPDVISYSEILDIFWRQINPTDLSGQFADRGSQYRPEIFVQNEEEREIAEASKMALEESGRFERPVVVPISDYQPFYPAEIYHQDYYLKNPLHYERYRRGSGRAGFLEEVWGS